MNTWWVPRKVPKPRGTFQCCLLLAGWNRSAKAQSPLTTLRAFQLWNSPLYMRKVFLYRNGKRPCLHSRCLHRLGSSGGLLSLAQSPKTTVFLVSWSLKLLCSESCQRFKPPWWTRILTLSLFSFWHSALRCCKPSWYLVAPWPPIRKARSVWRYFSMFLHWTHSKVIVASRHIIDICVFVTSMPYLSFVGMLIT